MLRSRSVASGGGSGCHRAHVCPGDDNDGYDGNDDNDDVCAVSAADQAQGPSPQPGHEQRRVQIQVQEDILEDGKSWMSPPD